MFEIGNSLREARLRQGLEYADAERVTKIRPKYLRALEEEQFELLPAQTYVKGFLNTYAEFLGLDGQLYVDEYNSRYVTREEDVPVRPRRSGGRRGRNRRLESGAVLAALLGIAVVFGLVIAAWNSGGDEPQTAPIQPKLRTPVAATLVVRAVRGTTRMEIREASRFGDARYGGTVERGRSIRFEIGTVLWVYLQKPAVVDLVVAGTTFRAPGRFVLVSARGISRAPAN